MSRRSKREMAPPPPSLSAAPPPGFTGWFPAPPPASMQATPGSTIPGPWLGGPPLPHPAVPRPSAACSWWPAPNGGAGRSSLHMDQNGGLDSDPQEWGMHPPGGFLNMFRNPTEQSPPQIVDNHGAKKVRKSASKSSRRSQPLINLDSGEDDGDGARTDRRLQYTKEEEVRLVSAWLNNSNDPINGNGKKTDRYWGDVTDEYNSMTPNNRRRTSKQLKDHFQKIKKKVSMFCSSWKEAVSVRNSGQSDEQVMDNAQKIYEEYKDGPFLLKHCWMILRDEPKWQVILEDNMVPNKRKFNEGGVMDEHVPVTIQSDDERPIGNKKAKAERSGKGKGLAKAYPSDIDDVLKKLTEIQGTSESRSDMLETQKRVSSEKLESARLNHLAAKEHAKATMLETYQKLIMKETSGMPEDVKAEHIMFLKCIRESIFGKTNDVKDD